MLKVALVILFLNGLECLKNVCDKDCISDVMLNKKNFSKDSPDNFSVVFEKIGKYEWNRVILGDDNATKFAETAPHNFVPEISSHERGRQT